jgi:hypothetical protein
VKSANQHYTIGGGHMTEKEEITKAVLELLAEIAARERKKAINKDEYLDAAVATILEVWLKEARKSIND